MLILLRVMSFRYMFALISRPLINVVLLCCLSHSSWIFVFFLGGQNWNVHVMLNCQVTNFNCYTKKAKSTNF